MRGSPTTRQSVKVLKRAFQPETKLPAVRSRLPNSRCVAGPASSFRRQLIGRSHARQLSTTSKRGFAAPVDDDKTPTTFNPDDVERAVDQVDVCIIGGGPAGLSAAIKLKQLANENGQEIRVILLEKGAEVGAHILSGAVIEPRALDELIPDWKELGAPLNQPATSDTMRWLTASSSYPMPHPPQMNNKGNYVISLSKLCRWLSEQAEALGVEIYPGFAAAALLFDENGSVKGVQTNDVGLDKSGRPKDSFEPGMNFEARLTLIAEGCHGSLSLNAIRKYDLRKGKQPQTYGLGIKEVWRVREEVREPGKVVHTLGWPLAPEYGGSWLYHLEDGTVSLGLVIGLDYANPHISPFREFQRLKHHPFFAKLLEGGECLAYGARALNEGGLQSIPKLTFSGGALLGCTAGFLNVPKIKGTHTAMKSGIEAAVAAYESLAADNATKSASESQEEATEDEMPPIKPLTMDSYQDKMENSWVWKELKEVRNIRPSFHSFLGLWGGIAWSGIDSLLLKGRVPFTFKHPGEDYAMTKKASECKPIEYPAPDGQLSFDILTSVARTGTNHAEDQPVHLVVSDGDHVRHTREEVGEYAGLLNKACPAGVYEYPDVSDAGGVEEAFGKRFVINSQNCIHCKTCSIKSPLHDITWKVPEGGGGPKYSIT